MHDRTVESAVERKWDRVLGHLENLVRDILKRGRVTHHFVGDVVHLGCFLRNRRRRAKQRREALRDVAGAVEADH
jgi:hypothetical protein